MVQCALGLVMPLEEGLLASCRVVGDLVSGARAGANTVGLLALRCRAACGCHPWLQIGAVAVGSAMPLEESLQASCRAVGDLVPLLVEWCWAVANTVGLLALRCRAACWLPSFLWDHSQDGSGDFVGHPEGFNCYWLEVVWDTRPQARSCQRFAIQWQTSVPYPLGWGME